MENKESLKSAVKDVTIAGASAQYDTYAKKILSHKIFLSHILKGTISEFKDMDPEEIVPLIENKVYVSEVPVDPGYTNQVLKSQNDLITGMKTESSVIGEGSCYYDIMFFVHTKNGCCKIIVNIEAQKKEDNLDYILLNRAIYYVCRMVSSQKEREFHKSNYDNIKDVYSIWLCFNMKQNCLNHIHLTDDAILGNYKWPGNIGMLNLMMIGLNTESTKELNDDSKTGSDLHQMLNVIFSGKLDGSEKESILNQKFQISVNEEIREELNEMTSLLYGMLEERTKEVTKEVTLSLIHI